MAVVLMAGVEIGLRYRGLLIRQPDGRGNAIDLAFIVDAGGVPLTYQTPPIFPEKHRPDALD